MRSFNCWGLAIEWAGYHVSAGPRGQANVCLTRLDGCARPSGLPERLGRRLQVPALQQELAGLRVIPAVRQLPSQRIGEAIVGVEEEGDVERVDKCLARRA